MGQQFAAAFDQGFFDNFIMGPDDSKEMILVRTADHQTLGVNRIPPCKKISEFKMILPNRNDGSQTHN